MIRNYRQIAKTGSNLVAWGSGRSQVISPVRDSIVFKINRLDFFKHLIIFRRHLLTHLLPPLFADPDTD